MSKRERMLLAVGVAVVVVAYVAVPMVADAASSCSGGVLCFDGASGFPGPVSASNPLPVRAQITSRDGGIAEVTGNVNAKLVNSGGTAVGTQSVPLYCEPAITGTLPAAPQFVELSDGTAATGTKTAPLYISLSEVPCLDDSACRLLSLAANAQGFIDGLTPGLPYNLHVQTGTVCVRNGQTIGDAGSPCAPGYPYLTEGERVDWPWKQVSLYGDGADAGQVGTRLHFYAAGVAAVVRLCPRVACR
jgi:hypothetical protein